MEALTIPKMAILLRDKGNWVILALVTDLSDPSYLFQTSTGPNQIPTI